MCGRFFLHSSPKTLECSFLLHAVDWSPRYNIAPTQRVFMVAAGRQNRVWGLARWGFVPNWAKGLGAEQRMINARSESASEKPAFREAFLRRRCIIPADGFYEWTKEGPKKGAVCFRSRYPKPLAIAGLWEKWRDRKGSPVVNCTILTTQANASVQPIHHRMPVLLDKRAQSLWLDRSLRCKGTLESLLRPCPDDWFRMYPVGRRVNSVKNDDPSCLKRSSGERRSTEREIGAWI